MNGLSTREAAKKLGISPIALSRYIAVGKVPAPAVITLGRSKVHVWTESEIERVRKLLPTIANGRKTRHQRKKKTTQTKKK
jgi:predicted DNA-binding transcriptional regulator AlpA